MEKYYSVGGKYRVKFEERYFRTVSYDVEALDITHASMLASEMYQNNEEPDEQTEVEFDECEEVDIYELDATGNQAERR